MAVRLADAVAYLSTNDEKLKQGLADGERKIGGWGSAINGMLMGAGMAAFNMMAGVAQQAVSYLGDAKAAASDLGETTSKINTLFGSESNGVLAWASTSATAFGLSKTAALDAVGSIGNMFMQLGAGNDVAASVGQGMVQLSADIASFHNVAGGSQEVLEAMSAGFRGEYDALQRYIPTINAAAVEQQALAMTGKENVKELTNLEKALAVQAIMMRDAGAAVGDFARTSDGAANQQRILDAQMANMQATMGELVLPLYTAFITLLNQLVQQALPPLTAFIREQAIPWMTQMGQAISGMVAVAQEWFGKFATSVDTKAVAPLNFFKGWLDQNMPRIQQIVNSVLGALTQFWKDHGEQVMTALNTFLSWMTMFWDTQFRTILNIVQVILQLLTGDFEGAGQTLQNILNDWRLFFETTIRGIVNGIRGWFNEIDWGGIGRSILDGIANGIRNGAGRLLDAARDAANGLPDAFKQILGIRSPSRVAAEEIGAPFVAGIGMGIRNSLASLTGDINGGLRGLMNGIQTPAAAGGIGGGVFNITINVSGSDAAAAGVGARDGVLSALRSVGLR